MGINGLVSQNSVEAYANKVIEAFLNPTILQTLRNNAETSADQYTVEAMVTNFGTGILNAMEAPMMK